MTVTMTMAIIRTFFLVISLWQWWIMLMPVIRFAYTCLNVYCNNTAWTTTKNVVGVVLVIIIAIFHHLVWVNRIQLLSPEVSTTMTQDSFHTFPQHFVWYSAAAPAKSSTRPVITQSLLTLVRRNYFFLFPYFCFIFPSKP